MPRGVTTWLIVIGIASLTFIVFYRNTTKIKSIIRVNGTLRKYTTAKKIDEMNSFSHNYSGLPCDSSLNLPQDEILEKVSSYQFPGIEHYIAGDGGLFLCDCVCRPPKRSTLSVWKRQSRFNDLFPKSDNYVLPHRPIFVTGLSSNHSKEGLAMIHSFKEMLNKNETYKLIVFDIGLTDEEAQELKDKCACEVRRFPFHKFPDHVRILRAYAWKPLLIQLVAKTYPFVVWIDASIRFFTTDIDELLQRAKHYGILAIKGGKNMVRHTSIDTFRYLKEPPCLFLKFRETATGFIIVYQTTFIKKYLMVPWVSCSLIRGCMVPFRDVYAIRQCKTGITDLFSCHRFEQSVLGILFNRLFPKNITNHYIKKKYYGVCRNCKNMV